MKNKFFLISVLFLTLSVSLFPQKRHYSNDGLTDLNMFGFNFGTKSNASLSISTSPLGISMSSGFVGGLDYGIWFAKEWMAAINVQLVQTKMNINAFNVESNLILGGYVGLRYYPAALKLGDIGRIYGDIYAGPVVGFAQKKVNLIYMENVSETVIGGHLGLGVDFFVTDWFKIGPSVKYYFMTNFNDILGVNKNLSGFAFLFNIDFVF